MRAAFAPALVVVVAVVVVPLSLEAAPDEDERAREDAMFGAPSAAAAQSSTAAEGLGKAEKEPKVEKEREDAIFGGGLDERAAPGAAERDERDRDQDRERDMREVREARDLDRDADEKLAESEDKLDLGALLWLRLDYATKDAGDPETFPLSAPGLLDVYLDGRPNDRVRAYARGRLRYDPTIDESRPGLFGMQQESVRAQLDQLWVKFDVERTLFVTAGKERVKWGAGRFWNPTDFLNQETLDPLSGVVLFDERLGVGLLKAHLPLESLNWNFYAIAATDQAFSPERLGGALRAEFLVGETEIALAAYGRRHAPTRLGASVSSGLWIFDVRGEIAVEHGSRRQLLRGRCDPNGLVDRIGRGDVTLEEIQAGSIDAFPELGTAYSRSDDWIPYAVLGAEVGISFGDDDAVYVGGEYFYNDAGYEDSSLYTCLAARGAFTPFYLGRHYAGAYVFVPAPGRWDDTTFVLSSLANVSDGSDVTRFDVQVRVLTYLDVNAYVSAHFGEAGDEMTFASTIRPLRLPPGTPPSVLEDLTASPTFGLLAQGVTVPKPLFEVGAGVRLSY